MASLASRATNSALSHASGEYARMPSLPMRANTTPSVRPVLRGRVTATSSVTPSPCGIDPRSSEMAPSPSNLTPGILATGPMHIGLQGGKFSDNRDNSGISLNNLGANPIFGDNPMQHANTMASVRQIMVLTAMAIVTRVSPSRTTVRIVMLMPAMLMPATVLVTTRRQSHRLELKATALT